MDELEEEPYLVLVVIGRHSRPLLTVSLSSSLEHVQTALSATEALREPKPLVASRQRVDVSFTWIAARGHAPLLDKREISAEGRDNEINGKVCWASWRSMFRAGGPLLLELVALVDVWKNATLVVEAGASCKSVGMGVDGICPTQSRGQAALANVQHRNQPKPQLDSRDGKDSRERAEPHDLDLLKLWQIDSDLLWRLITHAEAQSMLVPASALWIALVLRIPC